MVDRLTSQGYTGVDVALMTDEQKRIRDILAFRETPEAYKLVKDLIDRILEANLGQVAKQALRNGTPFSLKTSSPFDGWHMDGSTLELSVNDVGRSVDLDLENQDGSIDLDAWYGAGNSYNFSSRIVRHHDTVVWYSTHEEEADLRDAVPETACVLEVEGLILPIAQPTSSES